MDYDHLRNELVGNYSNLSRRLKQITRYAMSNPNDMALETIVVIAYKGRCNSVKFDSLCEKFWF